MYAYVNSREIEGKRYTAYRDDTNPRLQAIERDGEYKECRLKEVWSSDERIKSLWQQQ